MSEPPDFHQLLVEAAERLEPLPSAAIELAAIVSRPDSGPEEITKVLGTDPAMAAHVLREANSALSGSSRPIGSLDQAVVRIGAARVLEVAVRSHLGDRLETSLEVYDLDGAERRRLAVGASNAAEILSAASPHAVSRDVVCATLLHGIGMDVIDAVADPEKAGSLRRCGMATRQMEHELVAADHAEVGALVLRRWGLPPTLVAAVEHQHDPEAGIEAAIVCLATDLVADLLDGDAEDDEARTLESSAQTAITVLAVADRLDNAREAIRVSLADDGLLETG
ncbi:MAG: HDOD domain-containing protein [Actinomycetota bacterium]